jgi:hypothetical protein
MSQNNSKLVSPFSIIKNIYETRQLKKKQEEELHKSRAQQIEEECRQIIEKRELRQKQQKERIELIKSMSEEEKDRIYKQMVKEKENNERDEVLMYGFRK